MPELPRLFAMRLRLALAAALLTVGLTAWLIRKELQVTTLGLIVAGALVAFGTSILLLSYLRGEISIGLVDRFISISESDKSTDVQFLSGMLSRVVTQITKIQQELSEIRSSRAVTPTPDPAAIRDALRDDIVANVAAKLEQRYARPAVESEHVAQVRRNFESALLRLREELGAVTRRANLNLVIGTVTTIVAVGFLLYLLSPSVSAPSWATLVSFYVPRLTTVILIEVFAFFFLRLYKASLDQARYYQNEITSISLHWNAFELAISPAEKPIVIIEAFANANRNTADTSSPPVALEAKNVAELLGKVADLLRSVVK